MNKGIHQVRRAIKQRKKQHERRNNHKAYNPYPLIQEEDKHGFEPSIYNHVPTSDKSAPADFSGIVTKAVTCIVLFAAASFLFMNGNDRLSPTKTWLTSQLQEEFPFAKAKTWYDQTLGGTPLSIAPQGSTPKVETENYLLPVAGQVVETFEDNGTGIKISPTQKSMVTSFDSGIVVFAGRNDQTGRTVIIQHADGTNTTYGNLGDIDVHAYQPVEANQRIGTFTPGKEDKVVFFSIDKHQKYIDPAQVIPVDNIP